MINYYPYPANNGKNKFYIITNTGKKIYFGQFNASDFTQHKDEDRKNRYISRHQKNEIKYWNKSGINTPSFWSRFLLWNKPTLQSSYNDIKKRFLN
jgi:hypothetical protein